MRILIPITLLCTCVSVEAQILINESATPTGIVHEIDFDLLPIGSTDATSINSIASPNASNLDDIVLVPNPLAPTGFYDRNTDPGNALVLQNGGTEVIPPSGEYDAFSAWFLLGGSSSVFGIGVGDYVNTMELEFLLGGTSLGTIATSAFSTPDIKYFDTPGVVFDEVRVRTSTGGGNWVITGLAIGVTSGPALPALVSEGFVDGRPNPGADPNEFEDGVTLSWQVRDRRDLLIGAPGVFFLNVDLGEPPIGDSTPLLPSDFLQTTLLSTPTGPTLSFPAVLVGPSTGPAPGQTLRVPPGVLQTGTVLRLQPLVIDPAVGGVAPVRTSNPIRFEYQGPAIIVSAEGSDSEVTDVADGFWKVRHNDPSRPPIARVIFDGSTNAIDFDSDEPGVAGVFEGGNSLVAGCAGTYRNGSDVATGLVYDSLNTVTATPCDPTANTGWIGTNETTTDSFQTVEFRFNSFSAGQTFEFDADTDLALSNTGGAMAGMTITVELVDGTTYTGVLAVEPDIAVPFTALRSEVRF